MRKVLALSALLIAVSAATANAATTINLIHRGPCASYEKGVMVGAAGHEVEYCLA